MTEFETFWEKRAELPSDWDGKIDFYPEVLAVETSRMCGVKCAFCMEHGFPKKNVLTVENRPALFPESLYEKLLEACRRAKFLELFGFSEPFANEHMWKMVDWLERHGLQERKICLTTSGVFNPTEKNFSRAFGPLVKYIAISCYAATQSTYSLLQHGNLDAVRKNIKLLSSRRASLGLENTIPMVGNCLIMRSNVHEIFDLVKFFVEIGCTDISLNSLIPLGKQWENDWKVPFKQQVFSYADELVSFEDERLQALIDKIEQYRLQNNVRIYYGFAINSEIKKESLRDCHFPSRILSFSTDGCARICCVNHMSIVGNLHEQSFEEIWFGDRMSGLRRKLYQGVRPLECTNVMCSYPK